MSLVSFLGHEPINYYGKSSLNRLSFLRDNYNFLHQAISHPSTKFLILEELTPPTIDTGYKDSVSEDNNVITTDPNDKSAPPFKDRPALQKLVYFDYSTIKDLLTVEPFKLDEQKQIENWDSEKDSIGIEKPLIVFLGLKEFSNLSPFANLDDDNEKVKEPENVFTFSSNNNNKTEFKGIPYFAIDISSSYIKPDSPLQSSVSKLRAKIPELQKLHETVTKNSRFNPFGLRLSAVESTIFGQARHYADWNLRNRFCGGCGQPTMSVNGGCKLTCPPTNKSIPQPPCPTRGAITNLHFPRTDVSIISIVLNHDGSKVLLGRGKRFPDKFYSCLAGFLEPAETIEDCVRREIWEEAGIHVDRVLMYSSQPWPFPANIMIGCVSQVYTRASSNNNSEDEKDDEIDLGNDPELADAKWFDIEELRKSSLKYAPLGTFAYRPEQLLDHQPQIPPPEAVAWTLIDAVCNGRIKGLKSMATKI